jgi:alpha-L-fucosidase
MNRYISYMKSQLNELLTSYGKVGVLWFDGEWENTWNHERGSNLYHCLRSLSPNLIINNRVDIARQAKTDVNDSIFCGDFGTPEQQIPSTGLPGKDWESCMTMNDNWGYNKNDNNWKSSEDLIHKLIDITSKGGNFLLNVGPTADGLFPNASTKSLNEIGIWMKENSEVIYGTHASPFEQLNWGRCTQKTKDNNTILFLHIFNWPENRKILIPKLNNEIVRAYVLKDKGRTKLPVEITNIGTISIDINSVLQSNYATVIVLEVKGTSVKI